MCTKLYKTLFRILFISGAFVILWMADTQRSRGGNSIGARFQVQKVKTVQQPFNNSESYERNAEERGESSNAPSRVEIRELVDNNVTAGTESANDQSEISLFDTCPFYDYNPHDPNHLKLVGESKEFACKKGELLTIFEDNKIRLNPKIPKYDEYHCRARCVFYKENYKMGALEWKNIDQGEYLCDIVEVECKRAAAKDNEYKYVHSQIYEYERNRKDVFGNLFSPTFAPKVSRERFHPHVYIFLVDAVSMNSGYRQLPKTIEYLQNELEAVVFKRVAKVGPNSKPNAYAMFFGEIPIDVNYRGFGVPNVRKATFDDKNICLKRALDNESYVQFEYEDAGYKTLYALDSDVVTFGATWGHDKGRGEACIGIKNQLSTHYMRPLQQLLLSTRDRIRTRFMLNKTECRDHYSHLLDYTGKFLKSYEGTPKMSIMWSSYNSHNRENDTREIDPHFKAFFEENKEKLDDAFVILTGDHGPLFGKARRTEQGAFESSNPMMLVSLPKRLRNTEIHEKLKKNSKLLSSHHDFHATLVDIVRHQPLSNFTDTQYLRINGSYGSSWLRSFNESIPRSCRSLLIPRHFCICDYGQKEIHDKDLIGRVHEMVAKDVNDFLEERGVIEFCEPMEPRKVFKVIRSIAPYVKASYNVHFRSTRDGTFTTTYVVDQKGRLRLLEKQWERTNRYFDQADCLPVEHADLRPLCFCQQTPSNVSTSSITSDSNNQLIT